MNDTVEKRMDALEKRFDRLYAFSYARFMRRERKQLRPALFAVRDRVEGYRKLLARWKKERVPKVPKGKCPVYVTRLEYVKFRNWLRADFRGRTIRGE